MGTKEKQLFNYLSKIYLPRHLIDFDDNLIVNFDLGNTKSIKNDKFTSEDIKAYVSLHKEEIKKLLVEQLTSIICEPTYFTVDELIEIQSSDDPFTCEEIRDILFDELGRANYDDINCDVVEYCSDEIERLEKLER